MFIPVQSVARLANFNETVAVTAIHFTTLSQATKSSYKRDRKYISRTEWHRLPAVMFGVGVAFDFLAGTKSQAPRWMMHSGLEWAYRPASETSPPASRHLRHNPRIALNVNYQMVEEEEPILEALGLCLRARA